MNELNRTHTFRMRDRLRLKALLAIGVFSACLAHAPASAEPAYTIDWARQLGSSGNDFGSSVALDAAGNAYVSGFTNAGLDGNTSAGSNDAYLTKYDSAGTKLWTQQLGTASNDQSVSVAVDALGNAYISGLTEGDLDGNLSAGNRDTFVTKYNTAGVKQWTQQLGTASLDVSFSVALDASSNAYISGYTQSGLDGNSSAGSRDAFVTKYDALGVKQWTRQLGTSGIDTGNDVTVDGSGNIYISGYTAGGLDGNTSAGGDDAFVTKYDSAGTKLWTQQLGTAVNDQSTSVVTDSSGNVFIAGYTLGGIDGNTSAGGFDAFLTKYDASGTKQWTEQIGTAAPDLGTQIAIDSAGNIYLTGNTGADLDGNTALGGGDAFVTKYDNNGNKLWTQQFGTPLTDNGLSVALDGSDFPYISGFTSGSIDGNPNAGLNDIFLVRLVPEPASALMLMTAMPLMLRRVRR